MKNLLLTIVAMLLPMMASAIHSSADVQVGGYFYQINSIDKTAMLTYESCIEDNDGDWIYTTNYSGNFTIPSSFINPNDGVTYTVTGIDEFAFYNCAGLISVTIPNSVKSIGGSAFQGCTGLESIDIPEGVPAIESYTFCGCRNLSSIKIPSSVSKIGMWAFFGCTGLNAVHITDIEVWCNIKSEYIKIDCEEFMNPLYFAKHLYLNGEEVTNVVVPDGITELRGTFQNCINLNSVTIPNSVTRLWDAFAGCSGLTSITFLGSEPPACWGMNFYNVDTENCILWVPKGCLAAYKAYGFANVRVIGSGAPLQCAKPVISYADGKLSFSSATEGANFMYTITNYDVKSGKESEVILNMTYHVEVIACKEDYINSEAATMDITVTGNGEVTLKGDMDGNGVLNATDVVLLVDKIMDK